MRFLLYCFSLFSRIEHWHVHACVHCLCELFLSPYLLARTYCYGKWVRDKKANFSYDLWAYLFIGTQLTFLLITYLLALTNTAFFCVCSHSLACLTPKLLTLLIYYLNGNNKDDKQYKERRKLWYLHDENCLQKLLLNDLRCEARCAQRERRGSFSPAFKHSECWPSSLKLISWELHF